VSVDDNVKKMQGLISRIDRAIDISVDVGVLSDASYRNGATVVEVAAKHEYGIGVPRRSFLEDTAEHKRKELSSILEKSYNKILSGTSSAESGLGIVGVAMTNFISDAFETGGFGEWAELETSTIEKKGSAKILIDKATLSPSIHHRVNK
jgi:hypothetical protein